MSSFTYKIPHTISDTSVYNLSVIGQQLIDAVFLALNALEFPDALTKNASCNIDKLISDRDYKRSFETVALTNAWKALQVRKVQSSYAISLDALTMNFKRYTTAVRVIFKYSKKTTECLAQQKAITKEMDLFATMVTLLQ